MRSSGRSGCVLRVVWLGAALLVVPAAGSSLAAGADPEALIREGIELRRARDDLSALKRFQQAYELGKSPKAIAQVGLAEQALGRWGAADKHLRQALQSGDDPWIKKYRSEIDQALGVVSAHVGRLDVTGSPAGAAVRVDGEVVGRLPLIEPITVTAGGVAIEVRAPGYLPIVRAATVTAGFLTRENFNLQPLSPVAEGDSAPGSGWPRADGAPAASRPGASPTQPDPPMGSPRAPPDIATDPPPAPPDRARSHGALTWTAAGLAAVSLTLGVVEHLTWQRHVSSFDSRSSCGGSLPDKGSAGCQELYDDGQRAKVLAFVGYGLGAALAATAVILYVTDSSDSSDGGRVACAPSVTSPGIACALRF